MLHADNILHLTIDTLSDCYKQPTGRVHVDRAEHENEEFHVDSTVATSLKRV
jgi:hypothetical protein